MNLILLHPKIVHLPIALAIILPLLTGGIVLAIWRGWLEKRTFLIAVLFQAALLASGFAALQTGEADEEIVERVVAEELIKEHEERAETFMWAALAVLVLMGGTALLKREHFVRRLGPLSIVGTLVVFGLGYRVGEAGGALVYEHGAAQAHMENANNRQVPKTETEPEDIHTDYD